MCSEWSVCTLLTLTCVFYLQVCACVWLCELCMPLVHSAFSAQRRPFLTADSCLLHAVLLRIQRETFMESRSRPRIFLNSVRFTIMIYIYDLRTTLYGNSSLYVSLLRTQKTELTVTPRSHIGRSTAYWLLLGVSHHFFDLVTRSSRLKID